MMGPKKLGEINQELKDGLTEAMGDPVRWLDERLRELERTSKARRASTDVLESLRALFQEPKPGIVRRNRSGAKKRKTIRPVKTK